MNLQEIEVVYHLRKSGEKRKVIAKVEKERIEKVHLELSLMI